MCPNGVCFWIPRTLSLGQKLNVNIKVPLEPRPHERLQLQGEAEVVRVEHPARGQEGFKVAVRVIKFDIPVIVPAIPQGSA